MLETEVAAFAVEHLGRARITLRGQSMAPTLRAGMVAEVERLDAPPRRGDILVFRVPRGLVAHRFVAARDDAFITCGDALPDQLEAIGHDAVLGRVVALWSGTGPEAKRLDDRLSAVRGQSMLASRAPRALASRALRRVRARGRPWANAARSLVRFAGTRSSMLRDARSEVAEPGAFARLIAATFAFEGGDAHEGAALLRDGPHDALVAVALRHQMGGLLSRWIERAAAGGIEVPATLREPLRRARFEGALRAGAVVARTRNVVELLGRAGIEPIVLKGAARLARGEDDAELHFAGDVDVLVPHGAADRAVARLLAAGYRHGHSAERIAFFARHLHHRAPLAVAREPVPVEVHVALAVPGSVSQRLDYATLFAHSEVVAGPAGSVRTLDSVARALHLAYHGRDLRVLRDVVLLSRYLRAMSGKERAQFDALTARERRDRVRLQATIAAADALGGTSVGPPRAAAQYMAWAIAREDLPDLLLRRCHIVEALVARSPRHFSGWRESVRQSKGWLYNAALLLPLLDRWRRTWRVDRTVLSPLGFTSGGDRRAPG